MKNTVRKKSKKAATSGVLYVRNLPVEIADQLRVESAHKRQSLAGVLIELVQYAKENQYFEANRS